MAVEMRMRAIKNIDVFEGHGIQRLGFELVFVCIMSTSFMRQTETEVCVASYASHTNRTEPDVPLLLVTDRSRAVGRGSGRNWQSSRNRKAGRQSARPRRARLLDHA